jgi:hypothetical protein
MGLVRQHGLSMLDRPAGDAASELAPALHDLRGKGVARKDRDKSLLGLVGLVDRQRVVGDDLGKRVGNALEERVEALLGQHFMEDVGKSPV